MITLDSPLFSESLFLHTHRQVRSRSALVWRVFLAGPKPRAAPSNPEESQEVRREAEKEPEVRRFPVVGTGRTELSAGLCWRRTGRVGTTRLFGSGFFQRIEICGKFDEFLQPCSSVLSSVWRRVSLWCVRVRVIRNYKGFVVVWAHKPQFIWGEK